MGNKSLRRHSNVGFLFIISQIVKKESDLLIAANIKEKPFVFLVKLRDSIFSGFLNLLVGIAAVFNNFKDMVFSLLGNSVNVEVSHFLELKIFIESSWWNNGMNMRVPFQVPAKSMNDRNETVMYDIGISKVIFGMFRNFVFSFSFPADIVKDELECLVNIGRKFWKKESVIKEELSAFFRDSKKDMAVFNIENMLLNLFSPCHRIPVTARRTELRLASNREQVCNRTVRTFELDKAFWNIPAGKKFINRKLNIFKVTVGDLDLLCHLIFL